MGIRITRGKTLPIGVDLGTAAVKLAQLRISEDGISLLGAGAVDIPPQVREDFGARLAFLSEGIQQVIRSHPFKGRRSVLALPARDTFVHHIKIPKLSPKDTAKAARWELQGKLPCPVSRAVVQHIVVGDIYGNGEAKQEVITVSVPRATLDDYLAMAQRARLDVVGVNVECCALVECFSRLFRRSTDTSRTILFMDLGCASTQVVLSHGSRIAFARNLSIGGGDFDQAVADGMDMPLEQANTVRRELESNGKDQAVEDTVYHLLERPINTLVEQVTQCLRYHESVFRNQGIDRAIFLGGQAYHKRLCQTIAQQLNLPAQVADPLMRVKRLNGAGLEYGLNRRQPQPDWAVAVGLSLGTTQSS